jgi:hypothetical protein
MLGGAACLLACLPFDLVSHPSYSFDTVRFTNIDFDTRIRNTQEDRLQGNCRIEQTN